MPVPPKTFQSDDTVLDPAIKKHIASLYEAVDNHELEKWGSHFTEDAELKKGTSNVKGRATLIDLVTKSWSTLRSRDHTVYAVYPFGHKAEEVMMHGRSVNISKIGEESIFGALSNINNRAQPSTAMNDETSPDMPDLGYEMEQFLIQTYFEMAHSQYPMLLRHQFLKWYESWRTERAKLPVAIRWKGFFVYMVYAIAFLMTKSRINGEIRAQEFHALATTKYLPYLQALPNTLLRAQGFLLLGFYALHMPSGADIMALSSWTIRFCVMSQMHLAETEPDPINGDALIHIQHRRRVFWCAYAMDRAVCSSFHIPCSIPDNQITVPLFDKIDDDQLLASPGDMLTHLVDRNGPASISAALHIIVSRQLESQIQETVLSKDFNPQSEELFRWRSEILGKLKEWNTQSATTSEPSQKGYVSIQWLQMIYYYNIVMLFRPTKTIVQGVAGDLTVQACCQALLLFRKFQMAREIAQPWLGLLTQFQLGVCLLYCFFATPLPQWKQSYKSSTVSNAIRACSSTLAILAERWDEAECLRDVFEILAREISVSETWGRPTRISEAGRSGIEQNWAGLTAVLVHRPTLLMIREIITEDFVCVSATGSEQPGLIDAHHNATQGEAGTAHKEVDLQWADYTPGLLLSLDTPFDTENAAEEFSDDITFYL
ncbi:uncharacterized protein BHQ10_003318 [Talaromyces amestolkiae]|uniref:Xylanolytic transcriptional activator regulatory domain-containing protein n=1 Tax=Talaromyces amestolkiae TaxID=1196081 RepID=A0A364KUS5_TALAM|nr:uncharacterized protein BHQ10_003318 [Talaromyces amestolkiae]RAO67306.1 hypothetical protein BHQ10_003318 [Talaromyces amestolkiae]